MAEQVWDNVGGGAISFGVFPYLSDMINWFFTQQHSYNRMTISPEMGWLQYLPKNQHYDLWHYGEM